jgi:hypothetical protein
MVEINNAGESENNNLNLSFLKTEEKLLESGLIDMEDIKNAE